MKYKMDSLSKLKFKNGMTFKRSLDENPQYKLSFISSIRNKEKFDDKIEESEDIRDLLFKLKWTEKGRIDEKNEIDLNNLTPTVTDFPPNIKCSKCGNKTGFMTIKQTRSGDEGSTTFYTCAKCGNQWRVG
jgi:DNA-directed RNA polymerase subunit M/transcription elongation factor TFIIS